MANLKQSKKLQSVGEINKGGQAARLFYSSQIANLEILGLFQHLQIRKLLSFASPLTGNPQFYHTTWQPAKKRKIYEQTILHLSCPKRFLLYKNLFSADMNQGIFKHIFVGRKNYVFAEVLSPLKNCLHKSRVRKS